MNADVTPALMIAGILFAAANWKPAGVSTQKFWNDCFRFQSVGKLDIQMIWIKLFADDAKFFFTRWFCSFQIGCYFDFPSKVFLNIFDRTTRMQ